MFCPKCGSILMPKIKDGKKLLHCSCGYNDKDIGKIKIVEVVQKKKDIEIIENDDTTVYPITEERCPKCKNTKAWYWTVQMRAADEPETKFYKCTKCKNVWRER